MANGIQTVVMPDGTSVDFPDDMPDAEIGKVVNRFAGNSGSASPIPPPPISGIPKPDAITKLQMHKSYLAGDPNEDPDDPNHSAMSEVSNAVQGAGKAVYSMSAPNIAHQLYKQAKGQPYDLTSPIENAVMMVGTEGLEGMLKGSAERAAVPASTSAASRLERSFPESATSPSAGTAAGAAKRTTGMDVIKAGAKVVTPYASKASSALDLLKKMGDYVAQRGKGGGEEGGGGSALPAEGPAASAPSTSAPLAPHQSTAVPQSFPSSPSYPISKPVATTHEWLGANSPAKTVEEPADLSSTVPYTTSVKPILEKATINNGSGTADIPGANGQPLISTRPEAVSKLTKSSTPALPVRGPGGRMMKAGAEASPKPQGFINNDPTGDYMLGTGERANRKPITKWGMKTTPDPENDVLRRVRSSASKLVKKSPALADDAAAATLPKKEAETRTRPSGIAGFKRSGPGKPPPAAVTKLKKGK